MIPEEEKRNELEREKDKKIVIENYNIKKQNAQNKIKYLNTTGKMSRALEILDKIKKVKSPSEEKSEETQKDNSFKKGEHKVGFDKEYINLYPSLFGESK